MKEISKPQIQKLQVLYRQLDLVEQKRELLLHFTRGRTDSTAGLTMDEARDLIQQLAKDEPCEKHRQIIWRLAYKGGIIYGYSEIDLKLNKAKLNVFLRERGTVKKNIEKMNLDELKQVHRQFEGIVKSNARTSDNRQAKQLTDKLLNELNITTQK